MNQFFIPFMLALLAGLATGVGGLISIFFKDPKKWALHFTLGLSAGVMLYVSFVELLPEGIEELGFFWGNIAFFFGVATIMAIDFLVPHEYICEKTCGKNRKLMKTGVFVAIGIAIHNIPEGLAVFASSLGDLNMGIPLAFAIALHNIPEGLAIAMPIYCATKSKLKAIMYSFAAGFAEPVGALLGALVLMPFLSSEVLSFTLAFVAGIMVFISFDELLPLCYKHKNSHLTVVAIIVGMMIMALSLYLL